MTDLTWTTKLLKVSSLKEWAKNPRKISEVDFLKLIDNIKEYGFHDVLKIDEDGTIISGTQRRRALDQLNIKEITVMVPSRKLTEKEREVIATTSNLHRGFWDDDILANEFEIENLLEAGFEKNDLGFFELSEDDYKEDEEMEKIKEIKVKEGDFFIIDNHRIGCGDCTKDEVVGKLVGKEKARLIFTDPPYNVNYKSPGGLDYASKKFGGTGGKIFNDNKTDEDCMIFYVDALKNLYNHTTKDASIYWWFAHKNSVINRLAFKEAGFYFSQEIVWIKNGMVYSMGQDYHRRHEPCQFGWKEGEVHFKNRKYATFQDVMSLEKDDFELLFSEWYESRDVTQNYIHPTQKPVRLAERALKKNSQHGDVVIDVFMGSCSTGIACAQSGRKFRGMDLDPKYVHASLDRFAKFTGKDPIRESDGKAWSKIKDEV